MNEQQSFRTVIDFQKETATIAVIDLDSVQRNQI